MTRELVMQGRDDVVEAAIDWITTMASDSVAGPIPRHFELAQNYPNPFNPFTTIRFSLPFEGRVDLKIYDGLGREVAVLVDEVRPTGSYSIDWNATGNASGFYLARLNFSGRSVTQKMLLQK